MTKAELIRALKGLPDDTEIYVPSREVIDTWVHAFLLRPSKIRGSKEKE